MTVLLQARPPLELDARAARAAALADELEPLGAEAALRLAIARDFPGRIALVSSFGAESAALLHLVATIDRTLPVIFIDTGKHFAQTLDYRDELIARLGLQDVRIATPAAHELLQADAKGDLWRRDPDACCVLRKVTPNAAALERFDAWISGRKRHHGAIRASLAKAEHDGAHFKINPLAAWAPADIATYMAAHDLPPHPLVAQGFPSIGCWPCTSPSEGTNARAGRWAGSGKTECGIHRPSAQRRHAF